MTRVCFFAVIGAATALPPTWAQTPTDAKDQVELDQVRSLLVSQPVDPDSLMRLALLAESQGLSQDAQTVYRRILRLDRDHDQAYERLMELTNQHPLSDEVEQQRLLLQEFGPGFEILATDHHLVVYNTDRNWAVSRAGMLKLTHKQFLKVFTKADFRPLPLTQRLVCVLFEDHDQFAEYAQRVDHADMSWSGGYYSHRTNRIAFYHDKDNPDHAATAEHVAALEKTIPKLRDEILQAQREPEHQRVLRRELEDAARKLRWYQNRQNAVNQMNNTAKTAHEAAHQIAFNTAIQTRGVSQPFWVVEGLATCYEPDSPGRPFGPFADNRARRSRLVEAFKAERLLTLAEMAALAQPKVEDREKAIDLYAQSWGMFVFLFRKRQDDLRKYMNQLAMAPTGPRESETLFAEFENAFGPIEKLDMEWRAFLATLRP